MADREGQIAIVSMVRNEADVIESFVRHNLQVADVLYCIDHASTDGTSDILANLQREGLSLQVVPYDGVAQLQAELLTALMEQAFAGGAELVLPLDADEFIWPEQGRTLADVRQQLQHTLPERIYAWRWVRCRLAEPGQGEQLLLPVRPALRALQPEPLTKAIVGRAAWQATHCRLLQGSHQAVIETERGIEEIEPVLLQGAFLAHFPWRSQLQADSKAALGWLANVAKYSRYTNKANQWERAFQQLLRGEEPGDPGLAVPMTPLHPYAGAGQPRACRYLPSAMGALLPRVLAAAEQLAERCREEQVLRQQLPVSIVLPYLGREELFAVSLASILQEGYPCAELLVLPLVDDAFAAQLPAYLSQQATQLRISILQGSSQAERFADLAGSAVGEYVQWVLPGDQLVPGKLLHMLCTLLGAPTFDLVLSNGQPAAAPGAQSFDLPLTQTFMSGEGDDIAVGLRERGKHLSGGLSAMFCRRALMERHRWLQPFFDGPQFNVSRFEQTFLPGTILAAIRPPQVIVR